MAHLMHFNRAAIDGIENPIGKDREEYRDRKERGLYLYASRGGARTFFLYQKFREKPVRIKIGRYPDFSVAAARDRARELKGQMARGENPAEKLKKTASERVTVGQIGRKYIDTRKLSKNSVKFYQGRLDIQLKVWQHLPIVGISKTQLIKFHAGVADQSGKHMADMTMRIFGAFFNFFMDQYDHPGPNPVKTLSANGLWKTKKSDRRTGIVSKKDLPKWYRAVSEWESKSEQDYLLLLLFTGMRKTETVKLRWRDIDFEKRCFTATETKNGTPLTLPFNKPIREIFERCKERGVGEWVFPSKQDKARPMNPASIARKFSKSCEVKFTLHDLRRTFLTLVDELDVSEHVLKRLVNHSMNGDVTAGYIISDFSRLREPSEKIAEYILSLVWVE